MSTRSLTGQATRWGLSLASPSNNASPCQQLATLFTKKGVHLAQSLMAAGYRVAEVQGQIHDGEITILYVEVSRKRAACLIRDAAAIDGSCFCIVNDVRMSRYAHSALVHIGKMNENPP